MRKLTQWLHLAIVLGWYMMQRAAQESTGVGLYIHIMYQSVYWTTLFDPLL
jgi:hypothetical protein